MASLATVNQIEFHNATLLDAGCDPPEARDADGPGAGPVAFQRVQSGEAAEIAEAATTLNLLLPPRPENSLFIGQNRRARMRSPGSAGWSLSAVYLGCGPAETIVGRMQQRLRPADLFPVADVDLEVRTASPGAGEAVL